MKSKVNLSKQDSAAESDRVALTDRATDLFREHGTLFLEGAFPKDLIQRIAEAFAAKYESISKKELRKRDAVVGHRRYMVTVDIKKPFNNPTLYANPTVMPILEQLLSAHLRIASFGAVAAWPGAEAQPIHLDHPPLFEADSLGDQLPPYAVTLVIPLVEVTADMGPTAIWPGSHRSPDRIEQLQQLMTNPDYSDAEQPITKLGDAYMMDYRLIHGGMLNDSETIRPILYLVYSRPWFRDGFNFTSQPAVQISKKQRKKVPERWQGLFRG